MAVSNLVSVWREKSKMAVDLPEQTLCPVSPPDVAHPECGGDGQVQRPERGVVVQCVLGVERTEHTGRQEHWRRRGVEGHVESFGRLFPGQSKYSV